jgi:hypothetical protein
MDILDEGVINSECFEFVKMMAETGDFISQSNLANMYYEGEGVNKNLNQSLRWSKLAVENEECNEEEEMLITIRITKILFSQKNYKEALEKSNVVFGFKNLKQEFKDSVQIDIAIMHTDLKDGEDLKIYEYLINRKVPVIKDDAVKFILEKLGFIYLTNKEFEKCIASFTKSLEIKTNYDLHGAYVANIYNSIGYANELIKNYEEAHKFYLIGIDKGSVYSNLNLGFLYEKGLGVDVDAEKACEYYSKGSDRIEEWSMAREKF